MSRCDEIRGQLGRWYDDELDEPAARQVARHLRNCPACSAEVAGWRQIDQLLGFADQETGEPLEPLESLEPLEQRVLAAVQADAGSRGWWLRIAAAAILAAGVGGLGGWLTGIGQSRQPATEATSLVVLEETFSPGSLAGIDELAADLGARLPEGSS